MVKECGEEASIPEDLARNAKPVGAVSYEEMQETGLKRDVLFCYDLKLPPEFVPEPQAGAQHYACTLAHILFTRFHICIVSLCRWLQIISARLLANSFCLCDQDGEVESFQRLPIEEVAHIIATTDKFKDNCNLVIIDFLVRHGFLKPEQEGYLQLLAGLRWGPCT